MDLNKSKRLILACLREVDGLSKAEIHRLTGIRANTVGEDVDELLLEGLLRLGSIRDRGKGPRYERIHINPDGGVVVGLTLQPGYAESCAVNLMGRPVQPPLRCEVSESTKGIDVAAEVLERILDNLREGTSWRRLLGLGVSVPGFVDPQTARVTTSSAFPGVGQVSLLGLIARVDPLPVTLDNDVHATAARWMLDNGCSPNQALLFVNLHDGQVGSSLQIGGQPVRGCLLAAHELGHTRLPIETERCYCGQTGCLERIFSTTYLRRASSDSSADLLQELAHFDSARSNATVCLIVRLLAMAISNVVNLIPPHRLVLAGGASGAVPFVQALSQEIRAGVFRELAERVQIDVVGEVEKPKSVDAAWLALAELFGLRDREDAFISKRKRLKRKQVHL